MVQLVHHVGMYEDNILGVFKPVAPKSVTVKPKFEPSDLIANLPRFSAYLPQGRELVLLRKLYERTGRNVIGLLLVWRQ